MDDLDTVHSLICACASMCLETVLGVSFHALDCMGCFGGIMLPGRRQGCCIKSTLSSFCLSPSVPIPASPILTYRCALYHTGVAESFASKLGKIMLHAAHTQCSHGRVVNGNHAVFDCILSVIRAFKNQPG